jgi:hypothetical protein
VTDIPHDTADEPVLPAGPEDRPAQAAAEAPPTPPAPSAEPTGARYYEITGAGRLLLQEAVQSSMISILRPGVAK